MVGLLPCEPLDSRAVCVDADHICLNRFFYHVINLVIPLIVASEGTVCLPCTADGIRLHTAQKDLLILFTVRSLGFYSDIASCEISKFHPKLFPFVIFTDDICNTGIHCHPAFRHLVHVSVLSQLLRRINNDLISCFSFHFKFKHSGHILTEIIDLAFSCRREFLSLISPDHLHGRLELFHELSFRLILLLHNGSLFPVGCVESGEAPSLLSLSSVFCLRAVHIAHHSGICFYLKAVIRLDRLLRAVRIHDLQGHCQHKHFAIRFIGIRVGRHKRREGKGIMLICLDEPSIPYLCAQHIFALAQIVRHIKSHILDQPGIVCPSRIQFVVPDFSSIHIEDKLPQSADSRFRLSYLFRDTEFLSRIKRGRRTVCDPFSQRYRHFFSSCRCFLF